ncbi:MAG: endo-1,4-beta-xylanase [Nitrososphaerota archaeon]|nr:endo-1,4-beta-xylanase [Nitrososphaerota archaeon]
MNDEKRIAFSRKLVALSIGLVLLCLSAFAITIIQLEKRIEYTEQPETLLETQQPEEKSEKTESQQEETETVQTQESEEHQTSDSQEQQEEYQQPQEFEKLQETQEQEKKEPSLKSFAESCGIKIGTCVSYSPLKFDQNYTSILIREFNVITPENELKFEYVHPFRYTYNFRLADTIISFAEEHGIKVRGHCLVWHQQLPNWILRGDFTREELMEILRDHIYTVVRRYKGKIYAWDVVNEAIADDGSLRRSIWLEKIGPEYIELAFKWAHEADPDALLFYNDYGIEEINKKSNAVYELVKELRRKGVPIHGVGLQAHLVLDRPPDPESVARNIKRFEELGLIVEITEMDVRIREPVSSEELSRQAEIYSDILKVYLSSSNPQAFIMWGFVDKYSWIQYTFPGYGAALIFDDYYKPKPAYYSLLTTLEECSKNKVFP